MLTVYTPTYNRHDSLINLYESLLKQTCRDFVWLLLNDGSQDDTDSIVREWIKDDLICIKYLSFRFNRGKTHMDNIAFSIFDTPLFCSIDSDSCLYNNFVSVVLSTNISKQSLMGCVFHQNNSENGLLIGSIFPAGLETSSIRDLYGKHGVIGDKIIVIKKDCIGTFQYPIHQKENFMPEEVFYKNYLGNFPFLLSNEIIAATTYHLDGLSNSMNLLKIQNPRSFIYVYLLRMTFPRTFFGKIVKVAKGTLQILFLVIKIIYYKLFSNKGQK